MTFEWICFDLYGALIDVTLGLDGFFRRLLVRKQIPIPADHLVKCWAPVHQRMLLGPFRRYREILYATLIEVLRDAKVTARPEDCSMLATAFGSWRPYRDVAETLPRLQKVAKIALIVNADREFVTRSVSYLGVAPNLVVTSEDVRAYKPSDKPFEAALAKMYAPPGNCLYVATDAKTDLAPARKLGFQTWMLRRRVTTARLPGMSPLDAPSLAAIADRLCAPAAPEQPSL